MRNKHWLILAAILSLGLSLLPSRADDQLPPTDKSSPASAPRIGFGGVKSAPAKGARDKTADDLAPTGPLKPGPAVVREKNVNVRGQAAINSEVVARLKRGEQVTVLEEVTIKQPKVDEPARWAKIALPANTPVWVHSNFIDAASKSVKPNRLNLRSGPGENFSIIGRLEKGATVKQLETKGEWIKIEPPAGSYAFVAAHLLRPGEATPSAPILVAKAEPAKPVESPATPAPATPVPATPVEPATPAPATPAPTTPAPATPTPATPEPATPLPVTPEPVTPPTPVVPVTPAEAPASAPATPVPATPAPETPAPQPTIPALAPAETPAPAILPTPAAPETPVPAPAEPEEEIKRVVTREGIVQRSVSIQAPTYFVLESLDTGRAVNYLFSTNVVLRDFRGQRIIVSGEELLDERWPNTPVITVDKIQLAP